MEYFLKTSALLFLFLIGYRVFLQKETFFSSNRWFLLIGLITSFILPLLVIPIYETQIIQVPEVVRSSTGSLEQSMFVNTFNNTEAIDASEPINWQSIIWNLYWVGVSLFALRFLVQLISVYKIMRQGQRKPFKAYTIFETRKDVSPFSFFKAIIYNPFQLNDTAIHQILTHEKVHVKDWHSVDIILSEIALVFMWFNPLLWWYQKSLKQNLEFIADEHSVKEVPCPKTYQTVLVNQTLPNYQLAITNKFHSSFLKKRILMLNKSKSKPLQKLKMIFVLPFLVLFLFNFSTVTHTEYITEVIPTEHVIKAEKAEPLKGKTIEIRFTKETSEAELNTIKETLKKDGVDMTIKSIRVDKNNHLTQISLEFKTANSTVNYNVSDTDGIEPFYFKMSDDGHMSVGSEQNEDVIVASKVIQKYKTKGKASESNVWIEEDGTEMKITEIDSDDDTSKIVIKKGDTVVYEVISSGKTDFLNWDEDYNFIVKSGATTDSAFTIKTDSLKLNYKINSNAYYDPSNSVNREVIVLSGKKILVKGGDGTIRLKGGETQFIPLRISDNDGKPMIIVDGNAVTEERVLNLDSNDIETIEIFKGDNAVTIYGTKAKDGAVVIKTKNGNTWVRPRNKKKYKVSTIEFIDDEKGLHSAMFRIDKNATDLELEKLKEELAEKGIQAKYSKVKRNSQGEITRIKISLKNNTGSESSASYKSSDGIDTIYFGKKNGSLTVTNSPSN
ncbi:MAG: M56 family metallopeptidase [Bacteroidota bacterium]